MNYKIIYNNNSLSHFGILGMKWGVRNGPPYPLDYKDHSSSQKKLNPKSALNKYENNNPKSNTNNKSKSNTNSKNNKSKGFKLTDKQKTYIKSGIIVAGTIFAAYGIYKLSSSDFKEKMINAYTTILFDSKSIDGTISSDLNLQNAYKDVLLADAKGKVSDELYNRLKNGINTDPNNTLYDKNLWDNVLSKYEIYNIKNYTGSLAKSLNGMLRNLENYKHLRNNKEYKVLTKTISNAINKSELKEEVTSFRNVSYEVFEKMFKDDSGNILNNIKPGEIFKDNGFYSTSVLAKFNASYDQVRLTTILPKGAKALYIGDNSFYENEKELLVQMGSNFRILDVIMSSNDKVKEVICEYIK